MRSVVYRNVFMRRMAVFLVLIAVRYRGYIQAHIATEGLYQYQIPMTPSGMEPATFRLVAQCFNQLGHHMRGGYFSAPKLWPSTG